ncbi:hypothetical protein HY636_01765 [Candidatus Woesearchaeota archaeon]|nr:hypothetical protein [Candidatus Woesearchaeota archaeon]
MKAKLTNLRQTFYLQLVQKLQTLSDQLTWSHYTELLEIDEDLERNFYEKECISEKWSVRELIAYIPNKWFY